MLSSPRHYLSSLLLWYVTVANHVTGQFDYSVLLAHLCFSRRPVHPHPLRIAPSYIIKGYIICLLKVSIIFLSFLRVTASSPKAHRFRVQHYDGDGYRQMLKRFGPRSDRETADLERHDSQ